MATASIGSKAESADRQNVQHSDPIVLKDNSRTRVEAVLFYIGHNSGATDVSVKINTYCKPGKAAGGQVIINDSKSVSLDAEVTSKLFQALHDGYAIRGADPGDYLIIKLTDGSVGLNSLPPEKVASALCAALSSEDLVDHLKNVELTSEFVSAIRTSVHLTEMRNSVARLRQLLGSGEERESAYQDWCFDNSWAFGCAYIVRDDVRDISAGDTVDMLLPSAVTGYRDIVELKSPKFEVLHYDSSHKDYYFSAETSKVIGQCHRYLDVFSDEAQSGLRDHREVVAYCPRAIAVIGRSTDWQEEKVRALHGLNSRLSSIQIMTYDMLLAQCERLLNVVTCEDATDPTDSLENDFPW